MKEIGIPILETERLRLRPFRLSDFDDYAAMCGDPEVARYLSVRFSREQSWRHLAFLVGHCELLGYGMWAVEERETGAFVGRIGFADPDGWPGCELAWALARRWWGHGYATEGGRAALKHAFTVLGKDRVISLIHPENQASIRVAERLGESLQGRTETLGTERLVYGIGRESYTGKLAPLHEVPGTSSDGAAAPSGSSVTALDLIRAILQRQFTASSIFPGPLRAC